MTILKIKSAALAAVSKAKVAAVPLTDAEMKKLETLIKSGKDFSKPVKFDEYSDVIVGTIPDKDFSSKGNKKDGGEWFKATMVLVSEPNSPFATLWLRDEAELEEYQSNLGCVMVVVGKINERKYTANDGNEKQGIQIENLRAFVIINDPELMDQTAPNRGTKVPK